MKMDDSRIVKDPICGKDVDTLRARAVGIFGGVTYYFCSAECKAKYVDPRRAPRDEPSAVSPQPSAPRDQLSAVSPQPSAPEQKKPEKKKKAKEERAQEVSAAELHAAAEEEPVRYAHSRMRRITGEVATPVVQIELSPSKRVEPPAVAEEPLEPARSGRGWVWVAIVMLIIAGGVIWFTLKR